MSFEIRPDQYIIYNHRTEFGNNKNNIRIYLHVNQYSLYYTRSTKR